MVPAFRKCGVDVSLNNPLKRYDAAIYFRGMRKNSLRFVQYLKLISRRVYWDTCVDYFDEHEAADALQVVCARGIAGMVSGICVPTEGIAKSAGRFSDNVFVMPDPVNLEHFCSPKNTIDFDKPVFGWSGVACKAKFLAPYADFLDRRTRIVSEVPPELPFRYEFHRWDYATFPDVLLKCDIAFLPRTLDSTYTRNNSSFKALVFGVMGIPIIASRLPSYELLARDFQAIAFLEDHRDNPREALDSLRLKDRSPSRLYEVYDRDAQAQRLIAWLSE